MRVSRPSTSLTLFLIASVSLVGIWPHGMAQTTTTAPPTAAPTTAPPTTAPPTTAVPAASPTASPSTTSLATAPSTIPQITPDILIDDGPEFEPGTSSPTPERVVIGGPPVDVKTEESAAYVFTGAAGQSITITANRPWSLIGPAGEPIAEEDPKDNVNNQSDAIFLVSSGLYIVRLERGLKPPASLRINSVAPGAIVRRSAVGQTFVSNPSDPRPQVVRIAVTGGQRYRLVTNSQNTSLCANDIRAAQERTLGCTNRAVDYSRVDYFVPNADQDLLITLEYTGGSTGRPAEITGELQAIANDVVLDLSSGPVVNQIAQPGQSVVIPFWGSPADRAVLSSPTEANVSSWGQPWIDREEAATGSPAGTTRPRVFAVPVGFDPKLAPFVAWGGAVPGNGQTEEINRRIFGVYRGEDIAAKVPTDGTPITIKNKAWFAGVGSIELRGGDRYALQVTGRNIRPMSLAVRDPSGKFTSNLSPWQWSEDGAEQRAITTLSANRSGRWAIELRPAGNRVVDMTVSVIRVGSGGSFEGFIDVDDVLTVGESTDVQLGPNEFARYRVKLASPTPQVIQPDVRRYRNRTFQPTAADMSLWDSRGRLVWSNNRNLEEEVLSGRLGKEPELTEKFAVVSDADEYTLIVDPHTDLAGRFRVAVTSTPLPSDVALGNGAIPLLPAGTESGVLEIKSPTRLRFEGATGTTACMQATSLAEWSAKPPCVTAGSSLSFPPGVHRLRFNPPLRAAASLSVVAPSSPPDTQPGADLALNGNPVTVPAKTESFVARLRIDTPGTRVVFLRTDAGGTSLWNCALVTPDGFRQASNGVFVASGAGTYQVFVINPGGSAFAFRAVTAPPETQSGTLTVGAKSKTFAMLTGQRLELTVTVREKKLFLNTFGATLLFAANGKERRFASYEDDETGRGSGGTDGAMLELPPGQYRLVFVGNGQARIALSPKRPVRK
jgi:hypothetical protein